MKIVAADLGYKPHGAAAWRG